MIEIKKLCKAFNEHILFSDFDLEIMDGEFVVISGESGCGKTTLLNMIGAIEPVDSGSIEVNGVTITKTSNRLSYFARTVGFLFQNFALIEDRTVLDNLMFIPKANRSGMTIEEALQRVEMKGKENQKVYTLSGGEQQRIALARLMVKKCDLILADEPTGSLDKRNSDAVLNILQSMNREGRTVLVVTHDESIQNRGKRVIKL